MLWPWKGDYQKPKEYNQSHFEDCLFKVRANDFIREQQKQQKNQHSKLPWMISEMVSTALTWAQQALKCVEEHFTLSPLPGEIVNTW